MTAIFQILSGRHAGVRVELTDGTWVFGSDDSSDIVLLEDGLAPRHAVVTVKGYAVHVAALDGKILSLDGKSVDEPWPEGEVRCFGSILLAWGTEEEDETFWSRVVTSLQTKPNERIESSSESGAVNVADRVVESADRTDAQTSTPTNGTTDTIPSMPQSDVRDENRKKGRVWPVPFAFAVLLLFGGVTAGLLTNGEWRNRTDAFLAASNPQALHDAYRQLFGPKGVFDRLGLLSPEASSDETITQWRTILEKSGLHNVNVGVAPSGAFLLSGRVENDAQRGRLVQLARTADRNTVLDVSVDSDRTDPWKHQLESRGFTANVRLENADDPTRICVAAYMKTPEIERDAFERAEADLALPNVKVERNILHESDLRPLVTALWKEKDIPAVSIDYRSGDLLVSTAAVGAEREKVEKALKELSRRAGVPLRAEIVEAPPKNVASKASLSVEKAQPQSVEDNSMTPTFKVVSVSGGSLRFVTLSTGEKVFPGGRLPGGFTLESVSHDRLVLSKKQRRINYPLEVNP